MLIDEKLLMLRNFLKLGMQKDLMPGKVANVTHRSGASARKDTASST